LTLVWSQVPVAGLMNACLDDSEVVFIAPL
jgi:hypothetical protein